MEDISTMIPSVDDFVIAPSFETLITVDFTLSLKRVSCIHYLLYCRKDQAKIQDLINSGIEVNAMTPVYIKKLSFWSQKIDVEA